MGDLDDLFKAVGGLEARADNIEKANEKADQSRREIHKRLEQLGQEMISINNNVKIVLAAYNSMKPDVEDYKKIRQNINGGLIVLAGIGAALFTAIGFVLKDLWAWLVAHISVK